VCVQDARYLGDAAGVAIAVRCVCLVPWIVLIFARMISKLSANVVFAFNIVARASDGAALFFITCFLFPPLQGPSSVFGGTCTWRGLL
jgi:hypothetical protein